MAKPLQYILPAALLLFAFAGTASAELDDWFRLRMIKFQLTTSYDDNILRYSERDIDRFVNNSEYNPSLMTTYDDWKNDFRLKFYFYGPRMFGNRLRLYYFGKFSSYFRNPFNNYNNHTFMAYQGIGERVEVHFLYFYMPEYYLREYRDRDTGEFHSAEFENHQARPGVSVKITDRLEATFQAEYEQLYYNGWFTEYDAESWFYEGEVDLDLGRNWDISLGYGFKVSDNAGYHSSQLRFADPEVEVDSEFGDSSYEADIYQATVRYRFRKLWGENTDISLNYKLRRRYYTTDNSLEIDPFHAGRMDNRHRIIFTVSRDITPDLLAEIEYTHEWRNTDSGVILVEDIKDFRQNVIALSLTFDIVD